MTVFDDYELGEQLGEGAFSKVYVGTSKKEHDTGKRFAIKVLDKSKLGLKDVAAVENEVKILKSVDHANILRLFAHYNGEENNKVYLVTELCEGGELFNRIIQREFYSERDAQFVLREVGSALRLLHSKKIVHRDLKPENILLLTTEENSPIKLADFGFAKHIDDEYLKTGLGTPHYIAPEILSRQPYNESVDMWSFGVIAYVLLCGYPAFYEDDNNTLYEKILGCKYAFDSPYWDSNSPEAKDLISKLLVLDPAGRLTITQALEHPFLANTIPEKDITPVLGEMRNTVQRSHFKRAVNTAIALGRLHDILKRTKANA